MRTEGYLKSQRTAQHPFTLILPACLLEEMALILREKERKER
jgi:hypothetical protein